MPTSVEQQLSIYLTDVHAIELQALVQVRRARKVAGDPEIEAAFGEHVRETERHRLYVEDRLKARSWASVPQKDLSGKITGVGMALFADEVAKQLGKYLADAHAIEEQAVKLLEKAPKLAGAEQLTHSFEEHLTETRRHSELVERRLGARGESPSAIKDAALRLGALNLGMFLGAQADTPAKLAAFAYAFEHLEVAAYELLSQVAARAGDEETVALAGEIMVQERAAAARIHRLFDHALDASLEEAGVQA